MRQVSTFIAFFVIFERARRELWMRWAWTLRDKN